jgi:hypothetical protein
MSYSACLHVHHSYYINVILHMYQLNLCFLEIDPLINYIKYVKTFKQTTTVQKLQNKLRHNKKFIYFKLDVIDD